VELSGRGKFVSDCGRYQYIEWLELAPDNAKVLTVLGLNPVVPDAGKPDQTLGICEEFARKNGYGKLVMINLFALVSKGAEGVPRGAPPTGPENDKWLLEVAQNSTMIIGAWGDYPGIGPRVREVLALLKAYDVYCVQTNSNGSPRHPLAWRLKAAKMYRRGLPDAVPAAG
jgi:hypothetical protein